MRRVLKIALATAVLGFSGSIAAPASAAVQVGPPATEAGTNGCLAFTFAAAANEQACAGGYNGPPPGPGGGNLIGSSPITDPNALAGIQALDPSYAGGGAFIGDVVLSGNTFTFYTNSSHTTLASLSGLTLVGIHYGSANAGFEATSFFSFLVAPGTSSITVTGRGSTESPFGLSNAVLLETGGVPEPATWAMMLLGFGGIGMAMRRNRKANGRLLQVA